MDAVLVGFADRKAAAMIHGRTSKAHLELLLPVSIIALKARQLSEAPHLGAFQTTIPVLRGVLVLFLDAGIRKGYT